MMSKLRVREDWGRAGKAALKGFRRSARLKKPMRLLFSGPSGAGKTAAIGLGGKAIGKPVYKVSLSKIVSKYIGETEKNIEEVICKAERLGAILLFDEADALFGKRSKVRDAREGYANQEVSYLLSRLWRSDCDLVFETRSLEGLDRRRLRRFGGIVEMKKPC